MTQPQQPVGTAQTGQNIKNGGFGNDEQEIPCVGNMRKWALVCWVLILFGVVAWCIAAIIFIAQGAVCPGALYTTDTDTDCAALMIVGIALLFAGLFELCVISLIIYGVRTYQRCICIFGCIWAGLSLCSGWGVSGDYVYISVISSLLHLLALIFTAFTAHSLGQRGGN